VTGRSEFITLRRVREGFLGEESTSVGFAQRVGRRGVV